MDVKLSSMIIEDLDEISSTLSTEFDDFWKVSTLKSELENPNSIYLVAKSDIEVVGFAGIWKSVDEVHITDIVVKKAFRNQGIGKLLLEGLLQLTKENGFSIITLEVNAQNTIAQKLYLHYNFKKVRS